MTLTEILREFGLEDKEAKVYLTVVKAGLSSITEIAKKSGLKRPTTYLVIDDLIKKQLLITVPHGNKNYYKAEDPKLLLEKAINRQKHIETALPELQSLYTKSSKQPKVRFYEGKDALFSVYEEIFRSKEIWAMVSPERFLSTFSIKDNEHFFRILIRKEGKIYDLFENDKKASVLSSEKYRTGISEIKLLPKDWHLETDILVFNDKVAMISFENTTCVVIEDKGIASSQKHQLRFIWSGLN